MQLNSSMNTKKWIAIFIFCFSFVIQSFAQFPNPVTLATGQGPVGALDPLWTVSPWYTSNPPNPMGLTYTPALINNNCAPGAWVNPASLPPPTNNGKWITGNDASCSENTSSGYRYFRLTLNLPSTCNGNSIAGMGNYTLNLTGYVDNTISDVFVNGTSTGISGGNFAAGGQLNINLTGPWAAGVNYVDIMVYNFPSDGANPYGLLMVADGGASASLDSDGDGVTDLNDACVCEVGTLTNGCLATLAGNLTICQGQSTTLTVTTNGTILWSTGETTSSITVSPTQNTTYTVTSTNPNGSSNELTANVVVNPIYSPVVNQLICQGESYSFYGTNYSQSGTYVHNGQTLAGCDSIVTLNLVVAPIYSQTIPIDLCSGGVYQYSDTALTTAGNYVFEFQSIAGCDSIVTIALNILPAYQVNQVISACDAYFWNITNQNYTQSGVYQFLYTTEGGCDSLFILNLSVYPTPSAPVLVGNFPKCPGDAFQFSAESSTFGIIWTGPNNYTSNQFSNSIPLFTAQTGIYSAILSANGCSSPSSSIIAAIEFNNPLDFAAFPNVLTPNADGVNDVLNLPEYAKSCAKFNISIYNRWGVIVYTGDETSQPFDGTTNGTKLTSGVYFYKLLFEDKEKSGFIHLFD